MGLLAAVGGAIGVVGEAGSKVWDFSGSAMSLLYTVKPSERELEAAASPRGELDAQRVNEVGVGKRDFKVLIRHCDSHT